MDNLTVTSGSANYRYDGDITLGALGALVESFVHGHGVPRDAVITDVRYYSSSYQEPVKSDDVYPQYRTVKAVSVTVSWAIKDAA
jgi:hypothetical protein